MPAKKKRKPKYTSGVLCRDGNKGFVGDIAFAPGLRLSRQGVTYMGDIWYGKTDWRSWTIAKWKATYKLTPPRKGQAFECDVEL